MTGVRERGRPDPGCSAAQGRGGFNVTSWSSYREFTDRTLGRADLAPAAARLLPEDGSWETVSGVEARAGPSPVGGESEAHS